MEEFSLEKYLHEYIKDIVNSQIDISDLASMVANEISIDEWLIDSAIERIVTPEYISEAIDTSDIVNEIINDNISDIEDALDIDSITEKVVESIDMYSLTTDVKDGVTDDILHLAHLGATEFFTNFNPSNDTLLTRAFTKAVNNVINGVASESYVEDKNFLVGPFNGLEDSSDKSEDTIQISKSELDEIILSCIGIVVTQAEIENIYSIPANSIYDKVIKNLPLKFNKLINK
jgi:hypothetical protein